MADRIHDIKTIADELIRRIHNWAKDETLPPPVPADVALVIEQADMICHSGDIPQSCQALVTMVSRLLVEQKKYEDCEPGSRELNNAPSPSWWGAAKAVVKARQGVEQPRTIRRESVKTLLAQNVSRMQIAGAIYGRRGVGPLMQSNGTPDDFLIDQEAENPGSVLTGFPDWVPPWESTVTIEVQTAIASQLQALDRREAGRRYTDPETVEQMLRGKCYVQQIMRGKGVTRKEVLEEAKRIGVEAIDQPGWQPDPVDVLLEEESERTPFDKEALNQRSGDAVKAVEIWRANENFGSAEIVDELRKSGVTMTAKQVGQAIAWAKRKDKSETAVTE